MTDTPDIVEHVSTLPFEPTLERLTAAIKAAGLTLFCTIDHAAGAHAAGLEMPPATVLIYGNAKGGTPMRQHPSCSPRHSLRWTSRCVCWSSSGTMAKRPSRSTVPNRCCAERAWQKHLRPGWRQRSNS